MNINKTFAEIAQYRRLIEEAKSELEKLEEEVKKHMQEAGLETLIGDEHKATYKSVESMRFDSTAFKNENPALYESYKKPSISSRFTFS